MGYTINSVQEKILLLEEKITKVLYADSDELVSYCSVSHVDIGPLYSLGPSYPVGPPPFKGSPADNSTELESLEKQIITPLSGQKEVMVVEESNFI